MKLVDLLEEFNLVIDTPEGLNELRSLILGLAVRGKLVPQDSNDEPASELLKKIEAEKQQLYEEGEISKPKKTVLIHKHIPFEIPEGWIWSNIESVTNEVTDGTHSSPPTTTEGSPYITVSDLDWEGNVDRKKCKKVTEKHFYELENTGCRPDKFDILFSKDGTVGKVAVIDFDDKIVVLSSLAILRINEGYLYPYYLARSLVAPSVLQQAINKKSGSALRRIVLRDLKKVLVPIPPLAEQHRIVQKVESLFAEVDELEAKLNRQIKLDEKLQVAVNADVQQAPDAEASKSAWNFITTNFDTLYHTPEAIDNLKKNILNEAVRGRLVSQNSNDEPASVLLNKIEAEKQRLYEEGEIRKPKDLPPVKEDEIPFEIPGNWEWVRLAKINSVITDGEHISPEYTDKGVPMLSAKHIGENKVILNDYKYVSDEDAGKFLSKCNPEYGDILIVSRGGGVGRTVLNNLNTPFCLMGSVLLFKPHSNTSSKYLYYFFKTSYGFKSLINTSSHTAQQAIYISHLKEGYLVSLPPLKEQHSIVQRIEELFAICDRFKAQLEQREKVNERLVKGLVKEVLVGDK